MSTLFNNTQIAFRSKSNKQLRQAYWLFRLMGFPELTKIGTYFIKTALRLPLGLKKIIKSTLYQQFCGGETSAKKRLQHYSNGVFTAFQTMPQRVRRVKKPLMMPYFTSCKRSNLPKKKRLFLLLFLKSQHLVPWIFSSKRNKV
jgi:hypothetical protein